MYTHTYTIIIHTHNKYMYNISEYITSSKLRSFPVKGNPSATCAFSLCPHKPLYSIARHNTDSQFYIPRCTLCVLYNDLLMHTCTNI